MQQAEINQRSSLRFDEQRGFCVFNFVKNRQNKVYIFNHNDIFLKRYIIDLYIWASWISRYISYIPTNKYLIKNKGIYSQGP